MPSLTKLLSLAAATALLTPMTTNAELKVKIPNSVITIYGQIGAEAASVEYANADNSLVRGKLSNGLSFTENSDDMDRQTLTVGIKHQNHQIKTNKKIKA